MCGGGPSAPSSPPPAPPPAPPAPAVPMAPADSGKVTDAVKLQKQKGLMGLRIDRTSNTSALPGSSGGLNIPS